VSAVRLSDTQAHALERMYDRGARPDGKWDSSHAGGPSGTTMQALEARGLAVTKWAKKPYEHISGQLTAAGCAEVERRRRIRAARDLTVTHAELDVLEGLVRNADAGDKRSALDTIDRLRTVAS
jgi:hypothetical protein